jgi:hypothetical protein
MVKFNFFYVTLKFSTFIIFVMFTDELFAGFEIMCYTLTGLGYGQEELGYLAPLILKDFCAVNICAADFSWKVI